MGVQITRLWVKGREPLNDRPNSVDSSTEVRQRPEALHFVTCFPGLWRPSEDTSAVRSPCTYGLGNPAGPTYFSLNEGDVPDRVKVQVTLLRHSSSRSAADRRWCGCLGNSGRIAIPSLSRSAPGGHIRVIVRSRLQEAGVALTIEQGLPARICSGVPVMLRVHSAEEPARLAAALHAARSEIAVLGGGVYRYPYVTEPISIPGGFTMLIDLTTIPGGLAAAIPDTVVSHLRECGIGTAEIGCAAEVGDRYDIIRSFTPVAQAWLGGTGDRPLGKSITRRLDMLLVDLATEWLHQEYRDGMERIALAVTAEVPFDWETAGTVARGILGTLSGTAMFVTDFISAIASAVPGAFLGTGLSLMAAGAAWPAAEIASQMHGQREFILEHAPDLAWAGVTAQADNQYLLTAILSQTIPVPGPLWFQCMSAAQVGELGGPPEGSVELAGGRFALTVGDPEQWVPGHPDRDAVRARARRLITPAD